VFDADATARKAGGSKGGRLFRSANNPNEVVILFEWDNKEGIPWRQTHRLYSM
jgi:hypothetical protein